MRGALARRHEGVKRLTPVRVGRMESETMWGDGWMTLATQALGRPTLLRQAGLVLAGTILIAVSAKVAVPFWPVPLTMQPLAVMLVGFALGRRLGGLTVVAYLLEGLAGLPVFSTTTPAGPAAFAGPTAGFLIGFAAMAYVCGLGAERFGGRVVPLALTALASVAVLYAFGVAWPLGIAAALGITAGWATLPLGAVFKGFVLPFVLGDVLKSVFAALIVAGGMKALRRG